MGRKPLLLISSGGMAVVGQRVLISGMGGELGSRVASLLENEPWVESLEGIDGDVHAVGNGREVAHFALLATNATVRLAVSRRKRVHRKVGVRGPQVSGAQIRSRNAGTVAEALGYPIASSGVTIQIAQYELLVAAACAGLNSIISLGAICLFYGATPVSAPGEIRPASPVAVFTVHPSLCVSVPARVTGPWTFSSPPRSVASSWP